VARTDALYRDRLQMRAVLIYGLHILHGQDVVGGVQHGGQLRRALAQRLLPGRGVGYPPPSSSFTAAFMAGSASAMAVFLISSRSPHSEPKDRCVHCPSASSMPTAPLAKPSAEARHQGSGSSSIRSTPQRQAASARANFEYAGGLAPLDEVPGHDATNGAVIRPEPLVSAR
jgi:hypothetical protein